MTLSTPLSAAGAQSLRLQAKKRSFFAKVDHQKHFFSAIGAARKGVHLFGAAAHRPVAAPHLMGYPLTAASFRSGDRLLLQCDLFTIFGHIKGIHCFKVVICTLLCTKT